MTDLAVAPHELHGRVAKLRPVHFGPDDMRRVSRAHPRAVLSEATETLLLPVPEGHDIDLVSWLRDAVAGVLTRGTVAAES